MPTRSAPLTAIELDRVGLIRDPTRILTDLSWTVPTGQRWVVLGPNGSGKTSLARIISLYEHPSEGRVRILDQELGRTDVRSLRRSIGFVSAAMARSIRAGLPTRDFVMCGLNAALEPWWHRYAESDRVAAMMALDRMGIAAVADRPFGFLSSGETQRAQIARALVTDPSILVFDEPASGLDMGGREQLLADLDGLDGLTHVLVTHHLEEIPTSYTHALVLDGGRIVSSGHIRDVLTSETLSACFGMNLSVRERAGRWSATADE